MSRRLDALSSMRTVLAAPREGAAGTASRLLRSIVRVLFPWLVVVLIWEAAARAGYVNVTLFPPPSHFVRYVIDSNFRFGIGPQGVTMWTSILSSFFRVIVGLALGFVAALTTGLLLSTWPAARAFFMPLMQGLAPIAPIAWIPLGIVLFGVGNKTAIFIVFVGVFFVLTIATTVAVSSVDPKLIKSARTLGASKPQIWTTVVLPAVLPQVFTLLRINFFGAWMAVLAAEMVGLKNGLGAIIIMGREMFDTDLILVGMCLIGACGYAVDSLLLAIQRSVLWWQEPT
ncbi:MAG: ABC transporter permease [Xanthobacteraceae bacterium]